MRFAKLAKEISHFSGYVFGVAKSASILSNPYRSKLARPDVYILEEMVMDCPVVGDAESSVREGFVGPLRRGNGFKGVERGLLTKTPGMFLSTVVPAQQ